MFMFQFFNVVYHIDWFVDIKLFLHTWGNSIWPWCMILLMYYWIQFASILLAIFVSVFISDVGL